MRLLFSIVLILGTGILPAQTNYYVSPAGSDANPGTSSGQPWATVQYGLDHIQAGDILNLMAGSYNEKIKFNVSGTFQNPVILRNRPGDVAYLDGSGITSTVPLVEVTDQNWIMIQGLRIHSNEMNDAQGILISGTSSYITILQNEIYNINFSPNPNANVNANTNAQPLIVYGTSTASPISDLLISENVIHDCRTGYSEALAVNGNVMNFEIAYNQVRDISNIGIDIIGHEGTCPDPAQDQARNGRIHRNLVHHCLSAYATSGGIYVDGAAFLTIENNVSYRNGFGIEVGCENVGKSTTNIRVRNNLIYDNEVAGLALGGFDFPGGSGKVEFIDVRNNTLLKNDYSGSFTGELYVSFCENCLLRNNIFYTSAQNTLVYGENVPNSFLMGFNMSYCAAGAGALEYDWNGNFYTGFTAFRNATGLEATSFGADPLLVSANVSNPDFHISPGSPALNVGDLTIGTDTSERDIDGDLRPLDGRFDIGADEYGISAGMAGATLNEGWTVYPNPAVDLIHLEGPQGVPRHLEYRLWNAEGKLVQEGPMRKGGLNVAALNRGIYLLQLLQGNQVAASRKIMLR